MGGLIHNLNGPLQNIGIDMEMMAYSLQGKSLSTGNLGKNFETRLKRMEGEFDAINQLIRTASAKASQNEEDQEYGSLYNFFQQEFHFLKANLYFKHNIQKEIRLRSDFPSVTRLPEGVTQALSWFLQGLVEELEREKIRRLVLEGDMDRSTIRLDFLIQEGRLSDPFLEDIERGFSSLHSPHIDDTDVGMNLALTLFKQAGATLESEAGDPGMMKIRVILPLLEEEV